MQYKRLKLLKIRIDHGVAFVTIDNPPINMLSLKLIAELSSFARKVEKDDDVRVIVFDSADPDFFIAHFDVDSLLTTPDEEPTKSTQLEGMHPMLEAFRTMPKVSIAKIEGICRGGGSEFVLALDMRFGVIGKTILAQPEVAVGIIPGGGGTQRIPRLMGQARAMEVILSGMNIPAELAEKYGYLNLAFPSDEITDYVETLAYTIASHPAETLALAKKSIQNAAELPIVDGLIEEYFLFQQSTALPVAKARMKEFMDMGGQTREVEIEGFKLPDDVLKRIKDERNNE
jgi:enoyl-CoA hydratase/carnithine racemase